MSEAEAADGLIPSVPAVGSVSDEIQTGLCKGLQEHSHLLHVV